MELLSFILIFAAALLGGFYGSLSGGGSLVTIPVILALGIPPQIAIASNRVGVIGLGVVGWAGFAKKGYVDKKLGFIIAIPAAFGAIIGAYVLLAIEPFLINYIIAGVTLFVLALMALNPQAGMKKIDMSPSTKRYLLGATIAFFLGIYAGFYGASFGTFLAYMMIFFFGLTFLETAGTRKIAVLFCAIISGTIFIWAGQVNWEVTLAVLLGMTLGTILSLKYAERLGNKWIRRIFFVVAIAASIKLIFF